MRKILYIITSAIIMFVGINSVNAIDCNSYEYACVNCKYYSRYGNFDIDVYADETGKLNLDFNSSSSFFSLKHNFSATNFTSSNGSTLSCLNKIYGEFDGGRNGNTADLYNSSCKDCIAIEKTESIENKKEISNSSIKSCDYKGSDTSGSILITVTSDGKTISGTAAKGYIVKMNNVSPFTDKCPQLYASCGSSQNDKYCTVSSESLDVRDNSDGQEGTTTPTADDLNDDKEEDTQVSTKGRTIAILQEIYRIVKIAIPVLIVILSIVDFLKVVLLSDEKDYKSAWNKFVKRIVIGIIFFLVPVIVSLIISISGVEAEQNFLEIFK